MWKHSYAAAKLKINENVYNRSDQISSFSRRKKMLKFTASICYNCMCCRYRRFSSKVNQIICNQYEISLTLMFFKSTIYYIVYLKKTMLNDLCAVSTWLMILNRLLSFSFRGCLPCKSNHSLVKYRSCPHRTDQNS